MLLDKTLVLKGVAGVAALGGVVGGTYIYREELGIVSSSKKATDVQDLTSVDNKGIPTKCADSTPCSLTLEDLKKIKFKDLDNGAADSVEPVDPAPQITLTITTTDGNKKYTFNNNGAAISLLKKGSDKTVTLNANGTTEFTEEGEALKKVDGTSQSPQQAQTSDVDAQGIPNKCTSNPTNCELTEEDLKKIKFQVLDGNSAETVDPSPTSNQITLTITTTDGNNKKYTFNNSGTQITLKKTVGGSEKSVTLKGSGTTEFTVENNALKLVEAPAPTTDNKGIPTRCSNASESSPCELTEAELKKIKFEKLGDGGATADQVENFPSGTDKIKLKISNSSSSKKYIFSNGSSTQVTLRKGSDKTVTLKGGGDTEFTEENNALKEVEVAKPKVEDEIGVPTKCTPGSSNCQLTAEELKKIKFQAYGNDSTEGTVTISPENPNPQITLSISASGSTPKIYTFKNTSTSAVTLTKGSNKSVTLEVGDTEFTVESNKLKSYLEESFKDVNTKIGNLKLPNKCKFKSADKNKTSKECSVTVDELKKVKFSNKQDDQDLNIETSPSADTIKLEIKKLNKNADKDQYGSDIENNDPLITFKEATSKITIKGKDNTNIIIPKGSNMEFLMKVSSSSKNKLSKQRESLSGSIPPSWGITCKTSGSGTNKFDCTPAGGNTPIRFFTDSTNSQEIKVNNTDETKKIFTAEENVDDYNQGFKFKVNEVISGTPTLTKDDCYEIK